MIASKTKTSLIAALSLAFVAVPCSFAGDAGKHSQKDMFKSMDTNSDGKVTSAEHAAYAKQKFAKIDANSDNQVSAIELASAHSSKAKADTTARTGTAATPDKSATPAVDAAAMIAKSDKNNDGQLSAAEHASASEAMFAKLDTNHDGSLTEQECEAGAKMKH